MNIQWVMKALETWINEPLVKDGHERLSFKPEWFVDLLREMSTFSLDFN